MSDKAQQGRKVKKKAPKKFTFFMDDGKHFLSEGETVLQAFRKLVGGFEAYTPYSIIRVAAGVDNSWEWTVVWTNPMKFGWRPRKPAGKLRFVNHSYEHNALSGIVRIEAIFEDENKVKWKVHGGAFTWDLSPETKSSKERPIPLSTSSDWALLDEQLK